MKIWKYKIKEQANTITTITLPIDAKIISAGQQDEDLVVWAITSEETEKLIQRAIYIAFTGYAIPENVIKTFKFINTVQYDGEMMPLVMHVFAKEK